MKPTTCAPTNNVAALLLQAGLNPSSCQAEWKRNAYKRRCAGKVLMQLITAHAWMPDQHRHIALRCKRRAPHPSPTTPLLPRTEPCCQSSWSSSVTTTPSAHAQIPQNSSPSRPSARCAACLKLSDTAPIRVDGIHAQRSRSYMSGNCQGIDNFMKHYTPNQNTVALCHGFHTRR